MSGDRGKRGAPEAVFDRVGATYDDIHADNPAQLEALEDLVARLPDGGVVLDLGCGTGRPAADVVTGGGHDYVGVDESEVMLDLARTTGRARARFRRADLRDTSAWPPGVTGAVADFSLLMLSRDDIESVLRALAAHLPQGGLLSLAMVELDADSVPVDFLGETLVVSGYTRDGLRRVVEGAGFDVENLVAHTHLLDDRAETQLYVLATRTRTAHEPR